MDRSHSVLDILMYYTDPKMKTLQF